MSLIPLMKLRLATPGTTGGHRPHPGFELHSRRQGQCCGSAPPPRTIRSRARRWCARAARCWPKPRPISAISRCATWAPSAAASRMPIRRPIIRPRCWRWRRGWCWSAPRAQREIPIADFFVDTFTTALEPGEIIREVIVPVEEQSTGTSYQKMVQPASGFAIVGIAARIRKSGGKVTMARVGVTGLSGKPYRAIERRKGAGRHGGQRVRCSEGRRAGGRRRGCQLRSACIRGLSQAPGSRLRHAGADGGSFEDGLKISGSYTVPVPRERAYQLLQDPEILAKCMPGTDHLEKVGEDEYEMKMKMAIASIGGLFRRQGASGRSEAARKFQADRRRHRQDRVREGRRGC